MAQFADPLLARARTPYGCQFVSQLFHFPSNSHFWPRKATEGGQNLGRLHPCERPGRSSWLLALLVANSWEVNQQMEDHFMYFFFSSLSLFFFYDDDVYIAEKDVCPCGPTARMRRVKQWGEVDETTAFNLPFKSSCVLGKQG